MGFMPSIKDSATPVPDILGFLATHATLVLPEETTPHTMSVFKTSQGGAVDSERADAVLVCNADCVVSIDTEDNELSVSTAPECDDLDSMEIDFEHVSAEIITVPKAKWQHPEGKSEFATAVEELKKLGLASEDSDSFEMLVLTFDRNRKLFVRHLDIPQKVLGLFMDLAAAALVAEEGPDALDPDISLKSAGEVEEMLNRYGGSPRKFAGGYEKPEYPKLSPPLREIETGVFLHIPEDAFNKMGPKKREEAAEMLSDAYSTNNNISITVGDTTLNFKSSDLPKIGEVFKETFSGGPPPV